MVKYWPSAEALFPNDNFIFQQDNDPKHTSKLVKGYIQRKGGWEVFDWLSQSPDIKAWKNVSLNILQSLIDSMPRRKEAVIEAKGYPTKY